jgi:hypothetical protein
MIISVFEQITHNGFSVVDMHTYIHAYICCHTHTHAHTHNGFSVADWY